MVSMHDFARLRRVNIEEFQEFCKQVSKEAAAKGLTEEILNEILASDV